MMLSIQLFGTPRLLVDGQPLKISAPPKTIPLLAYLLLHRGQAVEREQAACALWPDDLEETGRANLRRHLHHLARLLPPAPADQPWILTSAKTLRWNPGASCLVDVAEFERQCACPDGLESAAALYRGDLLETVYDDWVFFERERLRGLFFDALTRLVSERRARRDFPAALGFAQQMLARDPFREDVLRQVIAIRYEAGDRAGALQEYDTFAHRLRQEMGLQPMPETQALQDLVRRNARLPGAAPENSPAQTSAPGKRALLPFVGRAAEQARFCERWLRAAECRGGLLLLGGEAGVGKSRLAAELMRAVEEQGGRVIYGSTTPVEARAYQPLAEALENALPLLSALAGSANRLAPLGALLPELRERLRLPVLPRLDADRERLRLFDAAAVCLELLAGPRPLLVVLEDLHWAGQATIDLLGYLAERVSRQPVLLLGTYRGEETPRNHPLHLLRRRLDQEGQVDHLALSRLSCADVSDLCARLPASSRQTGTGTADLAGHLFRVSEGSPLFIELLLQAGPQGGEPYQEELTGGLREALSRRLARLPAQARAYAETAAVLGQGFNADAAREVGGWDEAQAFGALNTVLDQRLARAADSRSRFDYLFAHHLIQACLYAQIPESKRRRWHLRAGQVLEELGETQAADLALHFDRGGSPERAAPYYFAAARQAADVFANSEALLAARRGLALLDEQPGPCDPRQRVEPLLLIETVCNRAGDRDAQQSAIDALLRLAGDLADEDLACQALALQIGKHRAYTNLPAQEEAIAALLARAEALKSPLWTATAHLLDGIYRMTINQYDRSSQDMRQALALYGTLGQKERQADCCNYLAQLAIHRRQLDEAESWSQQAQMLSADGAGVEVRIRVLWSMAACGQASHDLVRCDRYSTELISLAEQAGDLTWQAAGHRLAGASCHYQFRVQESLEHFTTAMRLYTLSQRPKGRALIHESLGSLYLAVGNLDESLAHYSEALAIQQQMKEPNTQIIIHINLAILHGYRHEQAAARQHALEGLELSRQVANRFLEALCIQEIAKTDLAEGRPAEATAQLDTALAMLDKMSQPVEQAGVLTDLARAYLAAGQVQPARNCAGRLLTLAKELRGRCSDIRSPLWAAARALRAAQDPRWEGALEQAYQMVQTCLAALPDMEMKDGFLALPACRGIVAARERGEWVEE